MEVVTLEKALAAIDTAGIKVWEAITDIPTHLFNSANQVIKYSPDTESLVNIAAPQRTSGEPFPQDKIVVKVASLADVHEIRCAGTVDEIKAFLSAYGITLSSEEEIKMVSINAGNYTIHPANGDYVKFEEKSAADVAAMTPQQQMKYNQDLAEYKNKTKMQENIRVTIS